MKFKDFFNKETDRDIAETLKRASNITMRETERERMRLHLSEYTKMRPIRHDQSAHTHFHLQFPAFLASIRPMPLIAALLIVSIGSSAVRAETALPGDILYPIKVHFIEEVQASLTRSPEAKAQWAVERAQRRLEEAVTLELSGNLTELAGAELDTNFEEHVRFAHESTQTPGVAAEIGAIQVARENILGAAKAPKAKTAPPTQPIARAKSAATNENSLSLSAETPQAATMSVEQDLSLAMGAAPEPSMFAAEAMIAADTVAEIRDTEIRARGHRTAAKVRIEAMKKFLESNKKIDERTRAEAGERLKIAIETLSSGDEKSSRGDVEAASEFEHALEAATEAGALISSKREDD